MKKLIILAIVATILVNVAPASALGDLKLEKVGGKFGFLDTKIPYLGNAIALQGFADLGSLTPTLDLEVGIHFWTKSKAFTYQTGPLGLGQGTTSIKASSLSFEGLAKYRFPVKESKFSPYAGGGLALHFIKGSGEINIGPESGKSSNSETHLGIDLMGGTTYNLKDDLDLVGELKYVRVRGDGYISMNLGVLFTL